MFNIRDFKSAISTRGTLQPNKFFVRITPPETLKATNSQLVENNTADSIPGDGIINFTEDARFLQFYAEGAALPGVNILTSPVRRYGYGSEEKRPIVAAFNDLNLTIIGDEYGRNVRFFQNWLKLMVNYDARDTYRTMTGIGASQHPFEVTYKTDYIGTIEVLVFNSHDLNSALHYTFREAYPINMIDTPLNWSDNNNLMRFSITISYFDWYEKKILINKQNSN